jgi:DNA polymerase-3 subunit delta'
MPSPAVDPDGWPAARRNPFLLGQETAERTLLQAMRSGRLHHAWLLTGPEGIGKATLAFRFARCLLARSRSQGAGEATAAAAGGGGDGLYLPPEHPVFRRVASGGHADLITIERGFDEKRERMKSEVVVDDARRIGGFLTATSGEGGWRIAVIDSADEMNRNAANAILKILEEPPPRALLLLVSHAPGQLVATVRSRCRRLSLRPLDDGTVSTLLDRYRPDLNAGDRADLVRLAGGSIGRALRLTADGRLAQYREMMGILATLPGLDVLRLFRFCEGFAGAQGDDSFPLLGDMLRNTLSRIVRLAATGTTSIPGSDTSDDALVDRLAAAAPLDRWMEVWEKADRLLAAADSVRLDRKQVLLTLFLSLQSATRP